MTSSYTNEIIERFPKLTVPFKKSRAIPAPTRVWSEEEMSSMKLGYFPEDMNEKWIIYMKGNRLFAHRSWSLLRIYEVTFVSVDGGYFSLEGGYRIDSALVNDTHYQQPTNTDEWESAFLELLIAGHLLGEHVYRQMPSSGNRLTDRSAAMELTMPQMIAERNRILYQQYLASKD